MFILPTSYRTFPGDSYPFCKPGFVMSEDGLSCSVNRCPPDMVPDGKGGCVTLDVADREFCEKNEVYNAESDGCGCKRFGYARAVPGDNESPCVEVSKAPVYIVAGAIGLGLVILGASMLR